MATTAKYKVYATGTGWVEYAFTPAPHTHLITDLPAIPQSKITGLTTDYYTKSNIQNDAIYMRNALVNANGVPTNNLGSPSLAEMALIDEQFDNKTAFYPISSLTVETFNGTTWTDITSSISDTAKKRFFGGDNIAGIVIPNGTLKYAITIRNVVSYAYLNALYMYWSSNGNSTLVHIWKKRDDGAWTQHTSSSTKVSSWPGHLFLPFPTIPWMPSGGDTHQHLVRVEFTPTWSHATNGITLDKMQWWGGYPASKRNLFSTDENKVVSFPAAINANGQAVVLNNDSRLVTPAEKTTWNGKEPAIAAGTTSQYYRGDKTWQNFPTIPTNTNQLTNGAGYITSSGNAATATKLANIPNTFSGSYQVAVNVNGVIYSHPHLSYTGDTGTLSAKVLAENGTSLTDKYAPKAHTHAYEPANANIQTHVGSAHAPSNAQKNSDITKTEIEAKLKGDITSHTHAYEAPIATGTTAQFLRGDKTWQVPTAQITYTTTKPTAHNNSGYLIMYVGVEPEIKYNGIFYACTS